MLLCLCAVCGGEQDLPWTVIMPPAGCDPLPHDSPLAHAVCKEHWLAEQSAKYSVKTRGPGRKVTGTAISDRSSNEIAPRNA